MEVDSSAEGSMRLTTGSSNGRPKGLPWVSAAFRQNTQPQIATDALLPILDGDAFEAEVRRQRAFHSRQGSTFVLLSFRFANADSKSEALRALAKTVRERARASDVVGWDSANGGGVSVILPACEEDAVQVFVRDVRNLLGKRTWFANGVGRHDIVCDVEVHGGLPAERTRD